MIVKRMQIAAVLVAITSVAACGTASGCESDPSSSDLAVGETTAVEIGIVNGGWDSLDVAGAFWATDTPVPAGQPENGTIVGTATLTDGDADTSAGLTSGSVTLELESGDIIVFEGPILCE